MRALTWRKTIAAVCGLTALALAGACGGFLTQPVQPPTWTPKRVAVLPFQKVLPDPKEGGLARSPLTGAAFSGGGDLESQTGPDALDRTLTELLPGLATFEVVPQTQAGLVFSRLQRENLGKPFRYLVAETGRVLNCDGVLVGHLYRFEQRQGSEYASEKPASVAFDLAMLKVNESLVVWKSTFDETQSALSDDVFKLDQYMQRGLRWYTAQDMARFGLEDMLGRFPWKKTAR
jgi:hypothetical protein